MRSHMFPQFSILITEVLQSYQLQNIFNLNHFETTADLNKKQLGDFRSYGCPRATTITDKKCGDGKLQGGWNAGRDVKTKSNGTRNQKIVPQWIAI